MMGEQSVKKPLSRLRKESSDPAWEQVNQLFKQHGLAYPPWRLRDELVNWLTWARYGQEISDRLESGDD